MTNPKTTISGYITLASTFFGILSQAVPGRWSQYLLLTAVGIGGAAAAIGNIQSQDGKH